VHVGGDAAEVIVLSLSRLMPDRGVGQAERVAGADRRRVDVAVHRALAGRELDAGGASVRRRWVIAAQPSAVLATQKGGQQPAGIPARNRRAAYSRATSSIGKSTQVLDMETLLQGEPTPARVERAPAPAFRGIDRQRLPRRALRGYRAAVSGRVAPRDSVIPSRRKDCMPVPGRARRVDSAESLFASSDPRPVGIE